MLRRGTEQGPETGTEPLDYPTAQSLPLENMAKDKDENQEAEETRTTS